MCAAPILRAALALLAAAAAAGASAGGFALRSPDVVDGTVLARAQVYDADGCGGGNLSPALAWSAAPAGTRSFAVTVVDPDAPAGPWWHWVLFDLRADAVSLARGAGSPGARPAGTRQTPNDFGTPGYAGACPPPGDAPHRYVFTIHALNTDRLQVAPDASAAQAAALIRAAELGHASISARFGR